MISFQLNQTQIHSNNVDLDCKTRKIVGRQSQRQRWILKRKTSQKA